MKKWHSEARRLRSRNPKVWTYEKLGRHFGMAKSTIWMVLCPNPERDERFRQARYRWRVNNRAKVIVREKLLRAARAEAKDLGITTPEVLKQWGAQ